MPSFIVHSIAGRELCKRLKLKNAEKEKFFIANLLPDTVIIERDPTWSDVKLRHAIQKEKNITHFRTDMDSIIAHPNLDFFLEKYKELVPIDIIVFGYFFHLYTDYYYFTKFLPKVVTFLKKDLKKAQDAKENFYTKINKTGQILEKEKFWGKNNPDGIYGDYNRLNKYLVDKYKFKFNYETYKKYISDKKLDIKIEEVNKDGIKDLLDELNDYYNQSITSKKEEFKIFKGEDIENLINEIIENFLIDYKDLLYKS